MSIAQARGVAEKWLWLLLLCALVAGIASAMVCLRLPRVYEARAKLRVVAPEVSGAGIEYNALLGAARLARTYAEVLKTRPVVEAAVQASGFDLSYEAAASILDVRQVRDTELLEIVARGPDPELVARLPNQLARTFIQQVQDSRASQLATSKDVLAEQVGQLATAIAAQTARRDQLRAQPADPRRDDELARVQGNLDQLEATHAAASTSLQDLLLADARGAGPVELVEPAMPPTSPLQPLIAISVIVAALLGLLVTLGVVLVFEAADDRLTSAERLQRLAKLRPLGMLAELSSSLAEVADGALDPADQDGEESLHRTEVFRLLLGLLQSTRGWPLGSLLVTSSNPDEGKSTVAAHLAVAAAQAGHSVVLVDAHLRQPSVHERFKVAAGPGLGGLLASEEPAPGGPATAHPSRGRASGSRLGWQAALVTSRLPNLTLLPAGPRVASPASLLARPRMRQLLAQLTKHANLVIVDSPPILTASDAIVLASLTDAILLVVDARRTRSAVVVRAATLLGAAGGQVLGALLNRVRLPRAAYAYSYAHAQPSVVATETPAG